MLNVAGSRYHFPTKLLFLAVYGLGLFLGFLYDNVTPDLYPNNSYRRLGWAITWILAVQSVLGALGAVAGSALPERLGSKQERTGLILVPMDDAEEQAHRPSGDSGQGTEEYSSRSPSTSTRYDDRGPEGLDLPYISITRNREGTRLKGRLKVFLLHRIPLVFNARAVKIGGFGYALVERFLVILGFMQICFGVVTGSGIFVSGIKLFFFL